MKFSENLKKLISLAGVTQTALADHVGVSPQSVQQWCDGATQPKSPNLKKISEYFGCTVDQLLFGEIFEGNFSKKEPDGLYLEKDKVKSHRFLSETPLSYGFAPVVGTAQLGDNGHWTAIDYPAGHGDGYVKYHGNDKNAYAIRCVGDSEQFTITPQGDAGGTKCTLQNEEGSYSNVVPFQPVTIHRDGNPMSIACENESQKGSASVEPNFLGSYLSLDLLLDLCIISCTVDGVNNAFFDYPDSAVVQMLNKK